MKHSLSHSATECFENCPMQYKLRYIDDVRVLPTDDPASPLVLGTALHRGIETDTETAIREYYAQYPIITDDHITEAIKLEYLIPKVKELLPEGFHEFEVRGGSFHGFLDLLAPATKLDWTLPHGLYDLYDFKYSNNIDHYMESRQLHLYKYKLERLTGKRIRKMFFVFIPKSKLKRERDEDIQSYRRRVLEDLKTQSVRIEEVAYDPNKVLDYFEICDIIREAKEFPKNENFLCKYCDYAELCKGEKDYMVLPSIDRRDISKPTKRKLWIYGAAFSGKTTFVDDAPNPLELNTDGNIQFVTMPYIPIKDIYEGRQKILAWDVFKNTIDELEKGGNEFKTIVVDLLEDTYELCRKWCYKELNISHESDNNFKAWDYVRVEFLSTIRRLMNLDYENIVLISHEDTSKDITKKTGDKITAIKPNIPEKIATKVAGMVDIVARVVVDDDARTLQFKSDEVVFGGGRLKVSETSVPLKWNEFVKIYGSTPKVETPKQEEPKTEETHPVENPFPAETNNAPARRTRKIRE